MYEKIFECFTNPVKCKLILEINAKKQVTAKQLAEACPEIPQTSLYRYLKNMTINGILTVVEERQIRGTVEKVYSLTIDFSNTIKKAVEENNGQTYMMLFTQYMMGLMQEFREYTSRPDIDIINDCSGFSLAPVYVSKEELENLSVKIGEILSRLMQNKKTPERKLHTIGIVVTPPKNLEEKEDS